MNKINELRIKLGRKLYEFENELDIKKIENGYVFFGKYYENIDDLMVVLSKEIEKYFKNK